MPEPATPITKRRSGRGSPWDERRPTIPKRSGKWMKVEEVLEELDISRSTFDDWRAKRRIPAETIRLPNGSLRISRADFENWLDTLKDAA